MDPKLKQLLNQKAMVSWDVQVTDEQARELLGDDVVDDTLEGQAYLKLVDDKPVPEEQVLPEFTVEPIIAESKADIGGKAEIDMRSVFAIAQSFLIPEYSGVYTLRQGNNTYRSVIRLYKGEDSPCLEVGFWKITPQYNRGCFRKWTNPNRVFSDLSFELFCKGWDVLDGRVLSDEDATVFTEQDLAVFVGACNTAWNSLALSVGAIERLNILEKEEESDAIPDTSETE